MKSMLGNFILRRKWPQMLDADKGIAHREVELWRGFISLGKPMNARNRRDKTVGAPGGMVIIYGIVVKCRKMKLLSHISND